jgi:hypothetical protein
VPAQRPDCRANTQINQRICIVIGLETVLIIAN